MMNGLVGFDPRDPMSGFCEPLLFFETKSVELSNLNVAWSTDFDGQAPMDVAIAEAFHGVVGLLGGTFGAFEEASPALPGVRDVLWTLRCVYYLANHGDRVRNHADVLSPNIIANVEAGRAMGLEDVARAERGWAQLYAEFQNFFKGIDLLIVPGNAVSAFRLDEGIPKTVGGCAMENYVDASLVRSILTLSGHPVIAIPAGLDHLGLPFGVQIVGPRHGDKFLLDAAAALEDKIATLPGLKNPGLSWIKCTT